MSFDCLASGSYTLTVDSPPMIFDKHLDRGVLSGKTQTLTGNTVVVQSATAPVDDRLRLRFEVLTLAQVETISDILDAGGVITARLTPGGSVFNVVAGTRDQKEIRPIIKPHPDSDKAGAALPAVLTQYWAEVTVYRL